MKRHEIRKEKIKIPNGADVKALDKKVKLWADRRVYGISWDCFNSNGFVSVDVWMHTGNAKQKWDKDFQILKRIIARSEPKPEPPPVKSSPPRQWHKRLRGHPLEQVPEIFVLERLTPMAKGCVGSVRIEVCKNYNGSGEKAFGGAKDWPVLDVHIPFQVGEEAKRLEVLQKLQKFIEENL